MRVLFLNPNYEDYLADAVFHGLRTLLGTDAVDFPKAEYLYRSAPPSVAERVRGHGFTLYGRLDDVPVDRSHVFLRALDGEFDLVVFGDIRGLFGAWTAWGPQLHRAGIPLAVLDGADRAGPYPFAGTWWREPGWRFLPRAHPRARYFKRELTPFTRWCASYLLLPPSLGRTLGIRPIAFAVPEELVAAAPPPKDRDFASQVVDPEVARHLGAPTGYAFDDEVAYQADLRRSRFGVTTRRAGWDALRHYEIAAAGAVPCFRDLHRKPETCAPHGLHAGNCIPYRDVAGLLARVGALSDGAYTELQAGALAWARANTTVERAREVLASAVP